MPVSSLVRRTLLTAVAAAAAATALAPTAAHAVPETASPAAAQEAAAEIKLAVRMARRTQALASLDRRADARARAISRERAAMEARRVVLARYGYLGDPATAEVVLPLATYELSAVFGQVGPLWQSVHTGQDFAATPGEPLVAVSDATVTAAGDAGPYGLQTILTLEDGTEVWYNHQQQIDVTVGQTVETAQVIGAVGSTGNSTGPHVHLEVRPGGGDPIDPMDWLSAAGLNP